MKRILIVERDRDLRDSLEQLAQTCAADWQIEIAKGLTEAREILRRQLFDGIILDTINPHIRDIIDFVKDARHRDFNLPILALIAYSDVILNESLKEALKKERVSYANKIDAFRQEFFYKLLEACTNRGFGEEITF